MPPHCSKGHDGLNRGMVVATRSAPSKTRQITVPLHVFRCRTTKFTSSTDSTRGPL